MKSLYVDWMLAYSCGAMKSRVQSSKIEFTRARMGCFAKGNLEREWLLGVIVVT